MLRSAIMDVQRKGVKKRKLIRWIITSVILVAAAGGIADARSHPLEVRALQDLHPMPGSASR